MCVLSYLYGYLYTHLQTEPVINTHVIAFGIHHGVVNTQTMVSDIHRNILKSQEATDDQLRSVSDICNSFRRRMDERSPLPRDNHRHRHRGSSLDATS